MPGSVTATQWGLERLTEHSTNCSQYPGEAQSWPLSGGWYDRWLRVHGIAPGTLQLKLSRAGDRIAAAK